MSAKTNRERQKKWREEQAERGFKQITVTAHVDAHDVIKTLAKLTTDDDFKSVEKALKKLNRDFVTKGRVKKSVFARFFR